MKITFMSKRNHFHLLSSAGLYPQLLSKRNNFDFISLVDNWLYNFGLLAYQMKLEKGPCNCKGGYGIMLLKGC